jgi:hypothetical protein
MWSGSKTSNYLPYNIVFLTPEARMGFFPLRELSSPGLRNTCGYTQDSSVCVGNQNYII